jgi:hypothetical protein
VKDAINTFVP